jgi:DNA-binding response OmpR family regulator
MSDPGLPVRKPPSTEKLIVIVEDDANIAEFLMDAFNAHPPYRALHASDGLEALHLLRTLRPDLLLLDYQLPHLNGLDLYDQICQREGVEAIPTLFMSANAPLSQFEQRQLAYIEKPFELEDLFHQIEQLLAQ